MNPIIEGADPNYWLSCMIIDKEYMCRQVRDDSKALYIPEKYAKELSELVGRRIENANNRI